ncbi:MAG: hypothetical protein EHM89_00265 [Acidobacteria bacterium]|nr:MAG: hypothetical protein EHM89_00265 [Acidobacteriota bacterium]
MKRLLFVLALGACAPTYRIAAQRCPSVWLYAGDFTLAAAAIAASVLTYNEGNYIAAGLFMTSGMALAMADNLAGSRCAW